MAVLGTSAICLVLTGNLRPSSLKKKQADEFGIRVLAVRTDMLQTVAWLKVFGKTSSEELAKLLELEALYLS